MVVQSVVNPLRQDIEVIALVGLAHGVSHFFQLVLPTLFPWLMIAFDLSFVQVGTLTTLCFVISALGQAPGGFIVDALGPHRVLVGAMSLFILAAALVASATGFLQLCIAAVLVGLGNSVFHPADFTLINRRVTPGRLGHAFSVHGLSGNLGWALAPALLAPVASTSDWRVAAALAASIAVIPWAIFLLRWKALSVSCSSADLPGPEDSSEPGKTASSPPERAVLSGRNLWSLLPTQFAFMRSTGVWMSFSFFLVVSVAFGGMQNFAPSVFIALYDVPVKVGAWFLSVFLAGGAVGMVLGGFLVARNMSVDRAIVAALVFASACLLALASGGLHAIACWLLMFSAGLATGLAGPARDMLVRQSAIKKFGAQSLGRIYGLVYSGLDVGIALSPLIFGILLDLGTPGAVLVTVAIFYMLGGLIALKMGRMNAREAH